jgi:hypothetical protein
MKSPSSAPSGKARNTHTTRLTTSTSATVATASRPIRAMVPRDITLSNRYRARSLKLGFSTAASPCPGPRRGTA